MLAHPMFDAPNATSSLTGRKAFLEDVRKLVMIIEGDVTLRSHVHNVSFTDPEMSLQFHFDPENPRKHIRISLFVNGRRVNDGFAAPHLLLRSTARLPCTIFFLLICRR